MAKLKTRITVAEYDRLTQNDDRWTELVGGEVVVNDPRCAHARLQAQLIHALEEWCRHAGSHVVAGPTRVQLTELDAYSPDAIVVRADPRVDDRDCLTDPPLVCVEVRSPSTWRYDVGRKKSVYEAEGVPELWLVDGAASEVLVFRRSTPDAPTYDVALELTVHDALTSPQLAGFRLPLGELFR